MRWEEGAARKVYRKRIEEYQSSGNQYTYNNGVFCFFLSVFGSSLLRADPIIRRRLLFSRFFLLFYAGSFLARREMRAQPTEKSARLLCAAAAAYKSSALVAKVVISPLSDPLLGWFRRVDGADLGAGVRSVKRFRVLAPSALAGTARCSHTTQFGEVDRSTFRPCGVAPLCVMAPP